MNLKSVFVMFTIFSGACAHASDFKKTCGSIVEYYDSRSGGATYGPFYVLEVDNQKYSLEVISQVLSLKNGQPERGRDGVGQTRYLNACVVGRASELSANKLIVIEIAN